MLSSKDVAPGQEEGHTVAVPDVTAGTYCTWLLAVMAWGGLVRIVQLEPLLVQSEVRSNVSPITLRPTGVEMFPVARSMKGVPLSWGSALATSHGLTLVK